MSSVFSISQDKLSRLIGTPRAPALIDVRADEDFRADPYYVPGSIRRSHLNVAEWADCYNDQAVVVICQKGLKLSQGVVAWLRQCSIRAETLEGGMLAWSAAKLPRVPDARLPRRDRLGRSIWITRERPKIDRIACPWLIRRFVDPQAVFLFVGSSQVKDAAENFEAEAFDIENTFWSHRGDNCTFDVMVEEFGLQTEALLRLAVIVRAADTSRLGESPEAAGLLAASLGLSRMYADDNEQLEAGMLLYDAFYRWCRDATSEAHNWPTNKGAKANEGAA